MKVLSTAAVAILAGSYQAGAFAPAASKAAVSGRTISDVGTCASSSSTRLSMNLPFFAQEGGKATSSAPVVDEGEDNAVIAEALRDANKKKAEDAELNALTVEEEIELLVQKELGKTKRMSNLRNEKGVEYAPWMGISEAEENKIRALMRDRTEARRRRQEEARDVTGNLFRDSQAQEISGTGLNYKIVGGEVELTWATKRETNTKGFIVKRRAAKTNDYSVVASYADYGPLASKGAEGGVYRYLDSTVSPGGWVYRISEEDSAGNQADICQCLVEVETEDEQKAAVIAGVGIGVLGLAAVVAGLVIDPLQ